MSGVVSFLRCVGRAAIRNGGKALASLVPGGEAAFEIARDACEEYRIERGGRGLPPCAAGEGVQQLEGSVPAILATELLHLPDKPAGVGKRVQAATDLASELLHLPDKPTGVEERPLITLRGSHRKYAVQRLLAEGDVADIHLARSSSDSTMEAPCILIISRVPEGRLLLENELGALTQLYRRAERTTYRKYLPTLIESFSVREHFAKRVNVFLHEPGFWTLQQVREQHPILDGRHIAWIFKRLLTVLGFCHRQGRVHGAVLLGHVLIHTDGHGLQLIGWGQSVALGRPIITLSPRYRDWYPPEVRQNQPATAATDLFLAARCMIYLAGGDPVRGRMPDTIPAAMRRFIDTCLFPAVSMRPGDAWKLLDEFDELLRKLYGPPKFHDLSMT
jgi:hypothetical protein